VREWHLDAFGLEPPENPFDLFDKNSPFESVFIENL